MTSSLQTLQDCTASKIFFMHAHCIKIHTLSNLQWVFNGTVSSQLQQLSVPLWHWPSRSNYHPYFSLIFKDGESSAPFALYFLVRLGTVPPVRPTTVPLPTHHHYLNFLSITFTVSFTHGWTSSSSLNL